MSNINNLFKSDKKYYTNRVKEKFPDPSLILTKKNPLIIFGAGRMGRTFISNLLKNGFPVAGILDNNKKLHGKNIDGIKIISMAEAEKDYKNFPILIASLLYETEIYKELKKRRFKYIFPLIYLNFLKSDIFESPEYHNTFNAVLNEKNKEDIIRVFNMLADNNSKKVFYNLLMFRATMDKAYIKKSQSKKDLFFEKNVLPLNSKEVFVDCGAYTGDSLENFTKAVSKKYKKIYSFEPDKKSFKLLKNIIKKYSWPDVFPIMKGVFNINGKVNFIGGGTIDGRIADREHLIALNEESISVVTIDDYFKNHDIPTLIKMDIEGAEIEALTGAKNIIKNSKPKLAISAYHRATDLWQIPLLINKLNNKYKFFFRHYSNELPDTICYAI